MIKLHIQLEPYNGIKFDFIEIEVPKVENINQVYAKLEEVYGKPTQKSNMTVKAQNGSDKKQFGALLLTEPQIYRLTKVQGYTEADLANATYDDLDKFMTTKKPNGEVAEPAPKEETNLNETPWELEL